MNSPKRPIFLCADDFGLTAGINAGILHLARRQQLSGTSCMSLAPAFARDAAALAELPISAGLHLSLTEPGASTYPPTPLSRLIVQSSLRRLPRAALRVEIARQCDAFERHMMRAPTHVDGHQHIHTLPQIRDELLEILQQRYGANPPWLRATWAGPDAPTLGAKLKAYIIQTLGARALRVQAQARGLPCSTRLLGVYGFDASAAQFLRHLERWVGNAEPGDVIMCHPAAAADPGDGLGAQRVTEFDVLRSDAMQALLARHEAGIVATLH